MYLGDCHKKKLIFTCWAVATIVAACGWVLAPTCPSMLHPISHKCRGGQRGSHFCLMNCVSRAYNGRVEASELSLGDSLSHSPLLTSVSPPRFNEPRREGLKPDGYRDSDSENRRREETQEMWPRRPEDQGPNPLPCLGTICPAHHSCILQGTFRGRPKKTSASGSSGKRRYRGQLRGYDTTGACQAV
mgnify:CR=1 FL=1